MNKEEEFYTIQVYNLLHAYICKDGFYKRRKKEKKKSILVKGENCSLWFKFALFVFLACT